MTRPDALTLGRRPPPGRPLRGWPPPPRRAGGREPPTRPRGRPAPAGNAGSRAIRSPPGTPTARPGAARLRAARPQPAGCAAGHRRRPRPPGGGTRWGAGQDRPTRRPGQLPNGFGAAGARAGHDQASLPRSGQQLHHVPGRHELLRPSHVVPGGTAGPALGAGYERLGRPDERFSESEVQVHGAGPSGPALGPRPPTVRRASARSPPPPARVHRERLPSARRRHIGRPGARSGAHHSPGAPGGGRRSRPAWAPPRGEPRPPPGGARRRPCHWW